MSTIRDLLNQRKQPISPEVVAGIVALSAACDCPDCTAIRQNELGATKSLAAPPAHVQAQMDDDKATGIKRRFYVA